MSGLGSASTADWLPAPGARRPRVVVLANGTQMAGTISAEVESNNHRAADRFRVSLALGPDTVAAAQQWVSQDNIEIEVQIAIDPMAQPTSLIIGAVDTVRINPVIGLIDIDGRDKTSVLIDAKTQEAFSNQTASQIATILAQRHGLTPKITATSTIVGQYYQLEHDKTTLDNFHRQTTEWDLLCYLADHEGFDVFVRGNTLYFQPAADPTQTKPMPVVFTPPQFPGGTAVLGVESLELERSLTLAKDVRVTVKTWNSKTKKAHTRSRAAKAAGQDQATAKSVSGSGKSKGGTTQNYVFVKPNMKPDDALKFANQMLAQITKHERIITFEMPGELALTPQSIIGLTGTGTDFDQVYFVDEIRRTIGYDHGFTQHVRAKNTSPRTESASTSAVVI